MKHGQCNATNQADRVEDQQPPRGWLLFAATLIAGLLLVATPFLLAGLEYRNDRSVIVALEREGHGVQFYTARGRFAQWVADMTGWQPLWMTRIAMLMITEPAADGRAWEELGRLTHLYDIDLWKSNFSDDDIAILTTLPELRYVNLSGTRVTLDGVEKLLTGSPKLRGLQINLPVDQARLASLATRYPHVVFTHLLMEPGAW